MATEILIATQCYDEVSACASAYLTPRFPRWRGVTWTRGPDTVIGAPVRGVHLAETETFPATPEELSGASDSHQFGKAKSPVVLAATRSRAVDFKGTGSVFGGDRHSLLPRPPARDCCLEIAQFSDSTGKCRKPNIPVKVRNLVLDIGGVIYCDPGRAPSARTSKSSRSHHDPAGS